MEKRMMMKKNIFKFIKNLKDYKFKANTKVVRFLICLTTIFNILAIISSNFAEFYRKYIFLNISIIFARISGLFPFSIGEIMIVLAIILAILLVFVVVLGFFKCKVLKKIRKIYLRITVYILLFVYMSETFNCFIMYHTKTIESEMLKEYKDDSDTIIDDNEKLLLTYNEVVRNLNELSVKLKRDENGDLISDFTYEECKKALRNISDEYECLSGYYPNPKKIHFSNIMSQQYLAGIYFPFSMEANYNALMYCANNPSTICHELSHLKGYIREDEANFIAFVACINSDNDFIRYSGYLQVLWYLEDDLYKYLPDEYWERVIYPNDYVMEDDIFLKQEVMEEVEEEAIISTETLSEATDVFIDTNLKMNGIESGYDNYSEVVKLIVLYYDCMNYNKRIEKEK